jgi:hypothetical protein
MIGVREITESDLDEVQGFDLIKFIDRETVIYARRDDQKVSWKNLKADPLVRGIFCMSAMRQH